jgi:hypothetical protein
VFFFSHWTTAEIRYIEGDLPGSHGALASGAHHHAAFFFPHFSSACASAWACLGSCNHRSRGKSSSKQFVIMSPR